MTLSNAINKVEKATGKKMQVDENGRYYVIVKNEELGFYPVGKVITQNTGVTSIKVRRVGDETDTMIDYFAGSYFANISKALKCILG